MDSLKPAEIVAAMVNVGASRVELGARDLLIRGGLSGMLLGIATSLALTAAAQTGIPFVGRADLPGRLRDDRAAGPRSRDRQLRPPPDSRLRRAGALVRRRQGGREHREQIEQVGFSRLRAVIAICQPAERAPASDASPPSPATRRRDRAGGRCRDATRLGELHDLLRDPGGGRKQAGIGGRDHEQHSVRHRADQIAEEHPSEVAGGGAWRRDGACAGEPFSPAAGPGDADHHGRAGHRHRTVPRLPATPRGFGHAWAHMVVLRRSREGDRLPVRRRPARLAPRRPLARLDCAFSRDQPKKIYAQHRMEEQAGDLWRWLQEGAHFYVCGDAMRMARDVGATLRRIAASEGGMTEAQARDWIVALARQGRYLRDVY
ncbi:MAG: hypothetical protein ABI369_08575 [Acetobacteraceae bacterium]